MLEAATSSGTQHVGPSQDEAVFIPENPAGVNLTPQKPQQNAGVCLASRSGSWRLGQLRKALKSINMTDKYVPIKYSQKRSCTGSGVDCL